MQRKSELFLCIPEPQPILREAKDSVSREEREERTVFPPFPEPQPILREAKDSASREEREEKTVFPPFPEPQPTFGDSKAQNTPPATTEAKKSATQAPATSPEALCAIWQTVNADSVAVRVLGVARTPRRGVPAHPWDVSRDPSHGISDPSHGNSDPWALSG